MTKTKMAYMQLDNRVGMDQATTESNIFNTLVNAGASVPADLTVEM